MHCGSGSYLIDKMLLCKKNKEFHCCSKKESTDKIEHGINKSCRGEALYTGGEGVQNTDVKG